MNFDNVRIVLVEPTHPGNIGATARAMKNMSLQRLVLVNPLRFPHAEATARAAGADDILYRARIVDGFDDALDGCRIIVGASARRRGLSAPELDPRECAVQVARYSASSEVAQIGRAHV